MENLANRMEQVENTVSGMEDKVEEIDQIQTLLVGMQAGATTLEKNIEAS
jgi:hypothetical protein